MSESTDLRRVALQSTGETSKLMADHAHGMGLADIQAIRATHQASSTMALLYVGDQIAEQVEVQRQLLEQHRLANVLAAIGRTELLDWETEQAAAEYVRARIGDIVNPESETDQ